MLKGKKHISFAIILFIGIFIFGYISHNKRVTFCDEIYTYMIVDSAHASYQLAEGQWYSREQITDILSHTDNDNIIQMFRNVKGDTHPPLYYVMVYLAAVVFGGQVTKWVPLLINMIMYIGTIIMFWMILYKLFRSPLLSAVGTLMYEINIGTLSDAMLLRMYMQLTFLVIAFAYATLLLYKNKDKLKYYVMLGLITAAGFLTQYYFCFIAIIFSTIWAIYNIRLKKYDRVVKYILSMLCAVIIDTVIWHYWINTILFNTDSDTIKENALNFANIFNSIINGLLTVQLPIFQNFYIIGCVFFILVIVIALATPKVALVDKDIKFYIISLAAVVWVYGSVVYYLTPQYLMSGRYFYVAGALEILTIVVCICALCRAYVPEGIIGKMVYVGATLFGIGINIILAILGNGIDYYVDASTYDEQRTVLEQYADYPWIICGNENWQVSSNYFDFIIPDKIMRITQDVDYREDPVFEEKEGFIIVAEDGEYDQSDTALYYYIGCTGRFAQSKLLMRRNNLAYYIAYPVD